MSRVSQIHDAMIERLAELFPTAQRIPHPSLIEANTEVILRDGYGVIFGSGNNTDLFVDGMISVSRNFTVVLSREMLALEGDPEGYATAEKALLEGSLKVVRSFLSDALTQTEFATVTTWQSDNGANLAAAIEGNGIFLTTEIVFQTQYFEQSEE